MSFIKSFFQNSGSGIYGLENALNGVGTNMEDATDWFFKILCINNPDKNAYYSFEWEALQYLNAVPAQRVIDYPIN